MHLRRDAPRVHLRRQPGMVSPPALPSLDDCLLCSMDCLLCSVDCLFQAPCASYVAWCAMMQRGRLLSRRSRFLRWRAHDTLVPDSFDFELTKLSWLCSCTLYVCIGSWRSRTRENERRTEEPTVSISPGQVENIKGLVKSPHSTHELLVLIDRTLASSPPHSVARSKNFHTVLPQDWASYNRQLGLSQSEQDQADGRRGLTFLFGQRRAVRASLVESGVEIMDVLAVSVAAD